MTAPIARTPHEGDYRLEVRDLGPIARANIEFRPLTVFVGPSNTGKSYLATTNYALHQFFARLRNELSYQTLSGLHLREPKVDYLTDPGPMDELDHWLTVLQGGTDWCPPPSSTGTAIRSLVEGAGDVADDLRTELVRCFGVDRIGELIRWPNAQAADVVVDMPRQHDRAGLRYHLRVRRDDLSVAARVSGRDDQLLPGPESRDTVHLMRYMQRTLALGTTHRIDRRDMIRTVMDHLVRTARDKLVMPLGRNAYYLPADRTGVMHSHRVVVSALVQRAALAALRSAADVPILSGVLADFLERLIQMVERPRRTKTDGGERLASRLEETVLAGRIRVESSDAEYPQFLYRPSGWQDDLPLMHASSMVSELASVVLYLRHVVRRGDVLIIEEPESHLHPAMQVEVIRCLADMVRSGIRVIITTHSEWMLDELANIIRSSRIEETHAEAADGDAVALASHEVGTWLFSHEDPTQGVVVKELHLDEAGLYPSGFDDVAVALHNRWAQITDRIEAAPQ